MQLSVDELAYAGERVGAFVGRESVLATIERFIDGPPGTLVVRGPPGSGKSAIAARLATASSERLAAAVFCRPGESDLVAVAQRLSDQLAESVPGFADERAETLAPEIRIGNVTVTTGPVAPGASVTGVRIVLDALGGERAFARGVKQPLRRLLDRSRDFRIVILVDALDEAGTDGAAPLPALLRALPGVHLVVTTRDDPRVVRHLRDVEFDIDLLEETADVQAFVHSQLQGRASGNLVARVAAEADANFLYARYVVDALLDSDELDDDAALPTGGLTGVYREFVRARAPGDADLPLFRAVLSAVTVARGSGVSIAQLAAIASAALGRSTSAGDVRLVVQRLGQFLAETGPDGPFRPYHRSFVEFLVSDGADVEWRVDETAAHVSVVRGLVRVVPTDRKGRADWQRADEYTRRHLVGHATAGGLLGELMDDARFVVAAAPGQLLPAFRRDVSLSVLPTVKIYRRLGMQLNALSPAQRAAQLGLVARQVGADDFADQLAASHRDAPWVPLWSHWRHGAEHSVIGRSAVAVRALALSAVDGVPVALWGDDNGTLRCSDLESGELVWPPVQHAEGPVMSVTTGRLEDRPIAVVAGYGGVRVWDVSTGKPMRDLSGPRAHQAAFAVALRAVAGAVIAIAGFQDGTLQLWDAGTGSARGEALVGHEDEVTAIAVTDGRDGPICVSADRAGAIVTRDLSTGAILGGRAPDEEDLGVLALAAHDDDQTPIIACAGYQETIYIRDPVTGQPRGAELHGHQDIIRSLAVSEADGRRLCLSAADDETLRIWDVAAGRAIGEPLRGHEGPVRSVAVTHVDGDPLLVSCGDDGTLRTWQLELDDADEEPRAATLEGPLTTMNWGTTNVDELDELQLARFLSAREWFVAQDFELNGVAIADVDGRAVAVTCGETSRLHAWELDTGERVGDPYLGDPTAHMLECVTVAQAGEHTIVITGGSDDAIRAWYLPDGEQLGVLAAEQGGVHAVAVRATAPDDDSLAFATGGSDGTVRYWDLVSGDAGEPVQAHESEITWLAVGGAFTASASTDGALRVWRDGETIVEEAGVSAAELATVGEQHVLVYADTKGAIHARELMSQRAASHLCDGGAVVSLALGMWRARPLLIAGGQRELRIWPLGGGAPELIAHESATLDLGARVSSVRLGPDGTVLAGTAAGVACIRLSPTHAFA